MAVPCIAYDPLFSRARCIWRSVPLSPSALFPGTAASAADPGNAEVDSDFLELEAPCQGNPLPRKPKQPT